MEHEQTEPHVDPQCQDIAKLNGAIRSGANWFYWIAGLSLVNSVIVLLKGNLSFVVGLGATQIVDGIAVAASQQLGGNGGPIVQAIALAVDACIASIFVLFGWLSNKRFAAAFVIGMIVYFLDGLIFLLVQDWLSIGFHIFALFCIGSGYSALRKLAATQ